MTPGPIQIVIDACNAPGAFDGAGGLPPLVASLKSCEPFTHIDFAAPVILCAERDAVFMPCFHKACCLQCAQQLSRCPICRVPLTGSARVWEA